MSDFLQVSSYLDSFNGNTVPLGNLCISITDCPHSTPKWTDNGLIVLRSNNIKGGVLDLSAPSYTDPLSFQERIKRATPEAGDIVITREAPMGEVCLIPDGLKCCLGQRMVLLKVEPTKISSQYLLFALQSELVQEQIRKSDRTGSTVSNLCIPDLKALEIPILFNTDGIAAILKAITGKIELNNRINAELEAMAKTLYNYWFEQFDFPDDSPQGQGNPYKTSGGKMVYNPTLKREIPAGWEDSTINEIEPNIVTGKTPSKDNPEYFGGNVPFITIGDIRGNTYIVSTEETLTASGAATQKNKFLPEDSICVTCIASPGLVGFVTTPAQTNQQINSVVCSNEINKYYLYFAIKRYFEGAKAKTGNTFSNMNKGDFSAIVILKPSDQVLQDYHQKAYPLFEQIKLKSLENKQLFKLRDWLLPMLMNGQVQVTVK